MFFSRDPFDDAVDKRNDELRRLLNKVEDEMGVFDARLFNELAKDVDRNDARAVEDARREAERAQKDMLSRALRDMKDKHKRVMRGLKNKLRK